MGLFSINSKYSDFFIVNSLNNPRTIEGDRAMSISKPSNIEIVLFVIVMLIGEHNIVLNNSVTP